MSSLAARRKLARNPLTGARIESLEARCLLAAKLPAQITIQENPSTPGSRNVRALYSRHEEKRRDLDQR